jgi:hypothetical protein
MQSKLGTSLQAKRRTWNLKSTKKFCAIAAKVASEQMGGWLYALGEGQPLHPK